LFQSILHAHLATGSPATLATKLCGSWCAREYSIAPVTAEDRMECEEQAGETSDAMPKLLGFLGPDNLRRSGTLVRLRLPAPSRAELQSSREFTSRFHLLPAAAATITVVEPNKPALRVAGSGREGNATQQPLHLSSGVAAYLGKEIPAARVACAEAVREGRRSPRLDSQDKPVPVAIEVCVVVDSGEEEDDDEEDEGEEEHGEGEDEYESDGNESDGKRSSTSTSTFSSASSSSSSSSSSSDASTTNSLACIHLVRLVNNAPMLDGPETAACALTKLLPNLKCWKKYGLRVEGAGDAGEDSGLPPYLPVFGVADAWDVGGANGANGTSTHRALEGGAADRGQEEEEEERERGEEGEGRWKETKILPVGVRLRNVFVFVHVKASSEAFPLPTLSKSRLPEGDQRLEEVSRRKKRKGKRHDTETGRNFQR